MKKIIIILAGVLIGFATLGQDIKKLDEKNGFRDIKLGISKDSVKDLTKNSYCYFQIS